jgi:hypothetical protein
VIPFYWGYRASPRQNRRNNGQWLDEAGNRLDKDLSKGGGPFANATTNLADMWKSGAPAFGGFIDWLSGDPLRPVLEGPGRMYFVLAAQRLAALVRMIRKYDPNDTVNIVAHSQGCLIALLAQAFLMEDGHRTADTLVLTHPPYGLEPTFLGTFSSGGGKDPPWSSSTRACAACRPSAPGWTPSSTSSRGVAAQRRDGWSADELAHMKRAASTAPPGSRAGPGQPGQGLSVFLPRGHDRRAAQRPGHRLAGRARPARWPPPAYAGPGAPQPASPLVKRKPLQELGPASCSGCSPRSRGSGRPDRRLPGRPRPLPFHPAPRRRADHHHVDPNITALRAHLPEADHPADRRAGASSTASACPSPTPPTSTPAPCRPTPTPAASWSVDPIDAAVAVSRDQGLGIRRSASRPPPRQAPPSFYPDAGQPRGA